MRNPKLTPSPNPTSDFEKKYWDINYNEPDTMDGIFNAKDHARYLHAFFSIYLVDINSIIDFGAGPGKLMQQVCKAFLPYRAELIEPSTYAFNKLKHTFKSPAESMRLRFLQTDLKTWAGVNKNKSKAKVFDLGLCNSVLQYIPDQELPLIMSAISKNVKYLYLSVPTDLEAKRMKEETDFVDPYAIHRSSQFYRDQVNPYFTIVGKGILESKAFFNQHTTLLSELLYRF